MGRDPSMALKMQDVSKSYSGVSAVSNFSLEVYEGEFVSFLGPSGCGKSTTLRMIAGLIRPDTGSIAIDGVDVTELPANKRPTRMVFQRYALFPHMTVMANVEYGLRVGGVKREVRGRRAAEALDLVRLPGLGNRYPSELSGGQQQRVALARALVMEPTILLLDEPLSNLDAHLRDEMQMELRALQRRVKVTTIFVTHDQSEALSLSDRVVVMDSGSICEVGSPEAVYRQPGSAFGTAFVGRNVSLPGVVARSRDGMLEVQLSDESRVLCLPGTGDLGSGESVTVYVKEENFRVHLLESGAGADELGGYENTVRGKVMSVNYLGDFVRLFVRTNAGDISIRMLASEGSWPREGAEILAGFRSVDSRAVRRVDRDSRSLVDSANGAVGPERLLSFGGQ